MVEILDKAEDPVPNASVMLLGVGRVGAEEVAEP